MTIPQDKYGVPIKFHNLKYITMRKSLFFFFSAVTSIGSADAQLKIMQSTTQPTTIKTNNVLNPKMPKEQTIAMGTFSESTPVISAPADPVKNNVRFFSDVAPNCIADEQNTKYIFLDILKEGRDRLLKFTPTNKNLQLKIEKDATGVVKQTGGYAINPDLKYSDELLTGNFSDEWGTSVIVVDRRANQFWRYRHDATSGANFNNSYSMLSNWVMDRHLTGDFNGDGKTDLLGWNYSRNEFSVALHTKHSTPGMPPFFTPSGVWLSGWAQSADMNIVTGDFNGDKRDDIAVVHQPTGEWRVALSNGSSFQSSGGYKSGVWLKPWAVGTHHKIAALDVNNDGKCDLIEYDYNDRSFQAVLSNGQYFDYSFKRENIGTALTGLKQEVAIGKFEGNCIIMVSHILPPDAYNIQPRTVGSFYLTSYRR